MIFLLPKGFYSYKKLYDMYGVIPIDHYGVLICMTKPKVHRWASLIKILVPLILIRYFIIHYTTSEFK